MGKTRKSKRNVGKVNPLGIPSIREASENEELALQHPAGPIPAIIEQLQSINIEEKMNALQSLAILSSNPEKVSLICSSDLLRIAAPLLKDPSFSVRQATAGALRNLSINGVDVCENLTEQDVVTPLMSLLTEFANDSDWIPTFDATMNDQMDEKSDTFLQAVNLLWNLCESAPIALESFNQTHILQSFIRYLDYSLFGYDISVAVAQCLLVISEDNSNAWRILSNYVPEFMCLLELEGGHPQIFLRSLAAGIISNVPALAAAHSSKIFTALSKTLDVNHRTLLGDITSRIPLEGEEESVDVDIADDSSLMEDESDEAASRRRRKQDLPSEIEIEVKHIGWLLESQRVSAEIITNLCSGGEDEWADDDSEELDSESVHDYDTTDQGGSSNNLQQIDKFPVEILEAIKSLGLVEKLWQRAQPIAENVKEILRENNCKLLKKVKGLRMSSLLCLQNLCNSMSTEDLGGPDAIYSVWLDLGQQVFQGSQDPFILEPSTSLMRAALEHLKHNPEHFKQMTESDLELMLNGVKNCTESEIRANWLRMLGILGCLLPEPLVKTIITFILETSLKEDDVWTISEAVDALMDMFSDNDWNQIAYDLHLNQRAKELEKIMKNKMRQQKRELKDRYPAVMTVKVNLARFSKYIETQLKNFTPNGVR